VRIHEEEEGLEDLRAVSRELFWSYAALLSLAGLGFAVICFILAGAFSAPQEGTSPPAHHSSRGGR
jgi:hypothetical protein